MSKYAPFHFYSCLKILIVNTSRFWRPFLKKTAVRYNRELESGNKMKVLKVLKDFFYQYDSKHIFFLKVTTYFSFQGTTVTWNKWRWTKVLQINFKSQIFKILFPLILYICMLLTSYEYSKERTVNALKKKKKKFSKITFFMLNFFPPPNEYRCVNWR